MFVLDFVEENGKNCFTLWHNTALNKKSIFELLLNLKIGVKQKIKNLNHNNTIQNREKTGTN